MPSEPQYVTATTAARLIGVNERTVRLWIDKGKLAADQPTPNRLQIPLSEVQRVIAERQAKEALEKMPTPQELARQVEELRREVESGAATPGIDQKVEQLEERLERIERMLAGLSTPSSYAPPATPRVRRSSFSGSVEPLPPGAMPAKVFAEAHGVNASTFRDHYMRGIHGELLHISSRPKPSRPHETEWYLTADDQESARAFWDRHRVYYQLPLVEESEERQEQSEDTTWTTN